MHSLYSVDLIIYYFEYNSINISDEDIALWSSKEVSPALTIGQIRDVARLFINGKLAGIHLKLGICIT
jgi:hypothetical protein